MLVLGTLGWGRLALRALSLKERLRPAEVPFFAFAAGFGIVGWLAFFPAMTGTFHAPVLAVLVGAGLPGLMGHWGWGAAARWEWRAVARWEWRAVALPALVIAVVAAGDLVEALSPPVDADSLAYHFAYARQLVDSGHLVFVPRAVDGVTPLLTQTVHGIALALGGERVLTLWCMVSGWVAAAMAGAVARRWLSAGWSLTVVALVMSMPMVLNSAGSGQVETRLAAFALAAAVTAVDSRRGGGWGMVVLSGALCGFLVASKYTGLLYGFTLGLVLLFGRGGFGRAWWFGLALLLCGCQWYLWNWWQVGDPVFPMLWGHVPYHPGSGWSDAQDRYFRTAFAAAEQILPKTVFWWLAYPVRALVEANPVFESGRTGFGPYFVLVAPFALAGGFLHRRRLAGSPLLLFLVIAFVFYSLWFWLGVSQRVRHFVLVVPLVVLVVTVAAERATRAGYGRAPLLAAVAFTLVFQMAAQVVFVHGHVQRLLRGESRDAFYADNVNGYEAVRWINANLPAGNRVLHDHREFNYLLDVAYFQANREFEGRIETRPDMVDVERFWRQVRANGITHVMRSYVPGQSSDGLSHMVGALKELGCVTVVGSGGMGPRIVSRSLRLVNPVQEEWEVAAVGGASCPLGG